MTDAPSAAVAPGFFAFVAFFIMAMVLWFLMRNMNARMRRMSYRQQAPVNENKRFGASLWNWGSGWRMAAGSAACIALVIGVLAVQDVTPTSTSIASADDAYSDITEIAILNTLDGY